MKDDSEIKYQVVTLSKAAEMLKAHVGFLARVSANAAERLRKGYLEAARSLQFMPRRCPWLSGEFIPATTYRALALDKRYLILFTIEETTVYIHYVLDCRQDYSWLLRD